MVSHYDAPSITTSINPYVEALHECLSKPGGKSEVPGTPVQPPVIPTPPDASPPRVDPSPASSPLDSGSYKNAYVEELHAKLSSISYKNAYVEELHAKLQSMGGSSDYQPQYPGQISSQEEVRLFPVFRCCMLVAGLP